MTFLVTGAAGFIGFHCARALLRRGEEVLGVDDLNPYYSTRLKRARLDQLLSERGFSFEAADIADRDKLLSVLARRPVRRVIHLAAQPGVRHSITHPHDFISANLVGFANVLEFCRHSKTFEHMVYASSSSVYGGNRQLPFRETDRVDDPVSLYAATKRSAELMSVAYAHLYGLPLTALRFFTVYGPWGRPDMAVWGFTEAIVEGRPIRIFNEGRMRRDFTYIDDITAGVVAIACGRIPGGGELHRIFNIGHNRPEELMRMITLLEEAIGVTAKKEFAPAPPGDLVETYADIDAISSEYGFAPAVPLEVGIPAFVRWYMDEWRPRAGAA